LQPLPQAPQFAASPSRFVHWVLQSVNAIGHWQTLPTQSRPPPHPAPHAPQLFASVVRFTHDVPHSVVGAMQVSTTHAPLLQVLPVSHA
jgi:hypothetical protein